jgi:iron complex outermembrane receptor protein
MTYDDMQIRTSVPLNEFQNIEIVASAGEAEIKGAELELDWSVNQSFLVQTSYSYLDTEISDTVINNIDRSGNELPKAPTHKLNVGGHYSIDLNESFGLRLRADYSYISEFHGFPQNDPIELVPSRENVNAGIAIVGANDNWSLELWGKNLTDELHPSTITNVQGTGYALPYDPPRTYGITLRVRN